MSSVISFTPRPAEAAKPRAPRPMTLFVHIRHTTLIAHLADTRPTPPAERVTKG